LNIFDDALDVRAYQLESNMVAFPQDISFVENIDPFLNRLPELYSSPLSGFVLRHLCSLLPKCLYCWDLSPIPKKDCGVFIFDVGWPDLSSQILYYASAPIAVIDADAASFNSRAASSILPRSGGKNTLL
jgi:hypothetical protein